MYRGPTIRMTADLSFEAARRPWTKVFKVLKEKKKINLKFSIQ